MPLAPSLLMPLVAPGPLLRAALRASLLPGLLLLVPLAARAEEACALKCVERQSACSANCAQGEQCRQHCGRAANVCLLRCQKTEEARDLAEQKRSEKLCGSSDGRRHPCTADEAKQRKEDMEQASKFMCRDAKGKMAPCPEHLKQLEEAKKGIERECLGGTCESGTPK